MACRPAGRRRTTAQTAHRAPVVAARGCSCAQSRQSPFRPGRTTRQCAAARCRDRPLRALKPACAQPIRSFEGAPLKCHPRRRAAVVVCVACRRVNHPWLRAPLRKLVSAEKDRALVVRWNETRRPDVRPEENRCSSSPSRRWVRHAGRGSRQTPAASRRRCLVRTTTSRRATGSRWFENRCLT